MNKIRHRLRYTVALIVVGSIFLLLLIQSMLMIDMNKKNTNFTSKMLISHIENVIEKNEKSEDILIEELKYNYIVRAKMVAYAIQNIKGIENNRAELLKICNLAQVDEIHLFNDKGVIVAGTNPEYYNFSFDDGEQIGYFKPMLQNKKLEMCQDLVPNTASGVYRMYAICWREDGKHMVQIGIEPTRLVLELKKNELSNIIAELPLNKENRVFIMSLSTGKIVASTDSEVVGKTLEEVGHVLPDSRVDLSKAYSFDALWNGSKTYYTYKKHEDYLIGIARDSWNVNNGVAFSLGLTFVYLCIAAVVIVVVLYIMIRRMNRLIVRQAKDREKTLFSLRQQMAVIEDVSQDYTDISIIDFEKNNTVMMKVNGKMLPFESVMLNKGHSYSGSWDAYVDKYVFDEDAKELLKKVSAENVLNELLGKDEYIISYRCTIEGKNHTFTVKFKKLSLQTLDFGQGKYICAFRCVDDILEEKARLSRLEDEAKRDKLTGFYNRRAYEDDVSIYSSDILSAEQNMVYVSLDLNSLKWVNDNLGHGAGDELLVGASICMKSAFGSYGKIYRTGGDEFIAIIFASDNELKSIKDDFRILCDEWSGEIVKQLSISAGFVQIKEYDKPVFEEICKQADERMYKDKALYYASKGVDRRGINSAYKILCDSYERILKINLSDDTYKTIKMKYDDLGNIKKCYRFSELLEQLINSTEVIHPSDRDRFEERTNIPFLLKYFADGNKSFSIHYKRLAENGYKDAMMEIVPSEEYSAEKEIVYLYVKVIQC